MLFALTGSMSLKGKEQSLYTFMSISGMRFHTFVALLAFQFVPPLWGNSCWCPAASLILRVVRTQHI